jgi:Uma2 family endonuclease
MSTQEAPSTMSVAEFIAYPNDGYRYELVEGKLVKGIMPTLQQSQLNTFLVFTIGSFVRDKKLGNIYGWGIRYETVSETANQKGTLRLPDVSFVQASRAVHGGETLKFAPDLAIEVLSEVTFYEDIEDKVSEYLSQGGCLVWLIAMRRQEVYICYLEEGKRKRDVLELDDTLDGGDVLPGFTLPVRSLFE